jgi:dipeptidyl aminopeptidase/acylaminoacyl peptidase
MAFNKAKPALSIDALWKMQRLGNPSLAPNGERVCVSVTSHNMQTNKARSSLWLLSANKPKQLTQSGDTDAAPLWSPDGKQIAFVAKRAADTAAQIYLIDPDGGEARRLTTLSTGCFGLRWFADSKRLAFLSWVWPNLSGDSAQAKRLKEEKDNLVKAKVVEIDHYRHWDHWLADGRQVHIHAVSTASGKVTDLLAGSPYQLPRTDPDESMYDIHPSGDALVFVSQPDAPARPDRPFKLVTTELSGTENRYKILFEQDAFDYAAPRFSPDGKRIACLRADTSKSYIAPQKICVLVPKSAAKTNLIKQGWTPEVWLDLWDREPARKLTWNTLGDTLIFSAEDRGRQHLYQASQADTEPTCIASGGTITAFDCNENGLAYSLASTLHPAQIYLSNAAGIKRVDSFNDAILAAHVLGETQEHWVKGAHGKPVQVWVTLPPNYDKRKKYPLLHSIHGGPHTSFGDLWHFRWNAQLFAAQGYVVAAVQYHGSTSFGQAFKESIDGHWGRRETLDIEAATDYLLKKGLVDKNRMVATGGSYGGYMVATLNGGAHRAPRQADRYKAYVCHAGVYDWAAMFADDAWFWHWRELGAYFWEDPTKVAKQSPHTLTGNMKTPTLVMHGELDYRVPVSQGFAYYNALRAMKVPSRLVYFPDENHWILKPQNSRLWHNEFFAWLKRFV